MQQCCNFIPESHRVYRNTDVKAPLIYEVLLNCYSKRLRLTLQQTNTLFSPSLTILLLCFCSSLHTSLLSGRFRGVSHLLAAFLCDSHSEHPLQDMLRASRALQCFHLAGVCQQCPQPCHLHHLQHRVQTGLHQDPQLLRETARQEIKMEMRLCSRATTLACCIL